MSKDKTPARPEARLAKGFRDIEAAELAGLNSMLQVIRGESTPEAAYEAATAE